MLTRIHKNGRRGTTLPEFAFVITICILFLFGIYEYGRFVMMKNLLDNAAREGNRYAVVHTNDKTTTDVENEVMHYLAGQENNFQPLTIQVFHSDSAGLNIGPWEDAQFGQYITVQLDGEYRPFFPNLLYLPSTMQLRARSIMYSEAN